MLSSMQKTKRALIEDIFRKSFSKNGAAIERIGLTFNSPFKVATMHWPAGLSAYNSGVLIDRLLKPSVPYCCDVWDISGAPSFRVSDSPQRSYAWWFRHQCAWGDASSSHLFFSHCKRIILLDELFACNCMNNKGQQVVSLNQKRVFRPWFFKPFVIFYL